uniref:Uncharacterized protein n=1 Tax=viral metagenome TaxID=1070528 RepID=A0A6M3JIT0_9ZZZZ
MKTLTAIKMNNQWQIELTESSQYMTFKEIDIDALCVFYNIFNPQIIKTKYKIIIQGD